MAIDFLRITSLKKTQSRLHLLDVVISCIGTDVSAISFAAQALSLIGQSSDKQKKRLIRRIHGAFQNPDEMRAIHFEMMAATHFVRRGHSIIWPDEMEETGTFDLLVENIGINGLEVECKSVSCDKGGKIHRREALEFFQLIKPQLDSASRNLRSGLAVVLTVPGRLPTSVQQKKELGQRAVDAILRAQSTSFDDGGDIRISEFDVAILGGLGSTGRPSIARETIDQVTATCNREAMVIGRQKGGAIVFVLKSLQDDTLLQYVFDTLSQSAKKQVSKTRPALFLVGLHSLGAEALLNVATQDFDPQQHPTALRVAVSKFLANQDRDHVVGVGFLSSSELAPKLHGEVESGGTAYIFPKHESSFWHQDFSGLFSSS